MDTSDIDWEQHEKDYNSWLKTQGIDDDLWWKESDNCLDEITDDVDIEDFDLFDIDEDL